MEAFFDKAVRYAVVSLRINVHINYYIPATSMRLLIDR